MQTFYCAPNASLCFDQTVLKFMDDPKNKEVLSLLISKKTIFLCPYKVRDCSVTMLDRDHHMDRQLGSSILAILFYCFMLMA